MKDAPARHRVEYWLFRLVDALLRTLPHAATRWLGARLGGLFYVVGRRRRRVAEKNLAAAFPAWPAARRLAVARASSRHLGANFFDTLSARRFDLRQLCGRVQLEGWEHVEAAAGGGSAFLITTPHFGHWEIAAWIVGAYFPPLSIVGRPLDNPHLDRVLTQLRTRLGNRLIPKHGAARGMLRALRAGEGVGLLIDQRVQRHEGIEIPFFGRPASTTPVLARLSIKTGAPVVPLYCYPEPKGRYRLVFHPAIEPAGEGDAAVEALTRRYLADAETAITERPELWLWAHDRWKGASPAGPRP
jgi:KDO2-lipid IV(A) lauroyltransferase